MADLEEAQVLPSFQATFQTFQTFQTHFHCSFTSGLRGTVLSPEAVYCTSQLKLQATENCSESGNSCFWAAPPMPYGRGRIKRGARAAGAKKSRSAWWKSKANEFRVAPEIADGECTVWDLFNVY